VNILYQVNDLALEPMADDVATLGLDMLLAEEGWKRGGRNPFLLAIDARAPMNATVSAGCNKAIAALHRCALRPAQIGAIRASALLHPTVWRRS
jgi:hypothetical protein